MDNSRSAASELLQSRLRDHQTEAARAQRSRARAARRSTGGRDDAGDELDASSATSSGRLGHSSPAGPSAWRFNERESSTGRRPHAAGSGNTSGPTNMGARELEENINKVSKENFDLKLEIFHRRQKIEKLEQELERVRALEADHADLLNLNEDLVKELELRDRAVDEAVVRIHDLEQYTDALEQRVAQLRNPRSRSSAARDSPEPTYKEPPKTPHKSNESRPMRTTVSPDVSARMAELALPTGEGGQRRQLPSFLSSNEPTTAALRRMFVDGDKVVRPIPSHATLLEPFEDDEADPPGDPHDVLSSPKLSEMDESDFTSMYAESPVVERRRKLQESPTLQNETSPQRVTARVNRWVADRAISPVDRQQENRSASLGQTDFQSLEQVLHRAPTQHSKEPQMKDDRRRLHVRAKDTKESRTPPMSTQPVFGQNVFPPTPDTMITRVSNNSSSSLGNHRVQQRERSQNASRSHSVQSRDQQDFFAATRLRQRPSVPSSLLPQEFDAYDEAPGISNMDGAGDLSPYRGRNYMSDSSEESPETPRRRPYMDGSFGGSTMIDAESMREYAPARTSTSPPRFFDSIRRSLDPKANPHLVQMALPSSLDGYMQRQPNKQGGADAGTVSSRSTRSGNLSNTSLNRSPQHQKSMSVNSGIPVVPMNASAPGTGAASPNTVKGSRTEALRQRFNKFARRNSTNTADSDGTPTVRKRSNSITQRFRLRRNSSTSQTAPQTPQDGPNPPAPFVAPTAPPQPASNAPLSSPRRAKSERVPGRRPTTQTTNSRGQSRERSTWPCHLMAPP